jgi:hypothetical protein
MRVIGTDNLVVADSAQTVVAPDRWGPKLVSASRRESWWRLSRSHMPFSVFMLSPLTSMYVCTYTSVHWQLLHWQPYKSCSYNLFISYSGCPRDGTVPVIFNLERLQECVRVNDPWYKNYVPGSNNWSITRHLPRTKAISSAHE